MKPPAVIRIIRGNRLQWSISNKSDEVYLTFDDGPTKGVTISVLDRLERHNARGTFFCLGKNMVQHPDLVQEIISRGHVVGNHGFEHLNGWRTKTSSYVDNVERCNEVFETNLFRPPYGKILASQIKELKSQYKIVMWSILSGDFDAKCSPKQCAKNVIQNIRPGSIVVFHDTVNAKENMMYALDETLRHVESRNWQAAALPEF